MRAALVGLFVILVSYATGAAAQSPATPELAPSGRLRVALIGSNPCL
jgi:hypothetical protein